MSDPNGADETVVTIEVEHVEGVISLPDMISRIDERANARIAGPPRAAADPPSSNCRPGSVVCATSLASGGGTFAAPRRNLIGWLSLHPVDSSSTGGHTPIANTTGAP